MAKKMNPFAQDFQDINRSADDKVLAFMNQRASEAVEENAPEARRTVEKTPAMKTQGTAEKVAEPTKEKATKRPRKKTQARAKVLKTSSQAEWGKPVAIFNTRIPQEMSDLLDDLVYRRKKEGCPVTKQQLAIDALGELLQTTGLLNSKTHCDNPES